MRRASACRIAPALLLVAFAAPAVRAQTTYSLNVATGGSWATASNWSPSGVPGTAQTDIAVFSNVPLSAATTVTLDGAFTIGALRFNDSATGAVTLNPGIGGPLTLRAG